jgi:hypothetical protein
MSPSANSKLDLSSIDIERIVREVLASVLPAMLFPFVSTASSLPTRPFPVESW